MKSNKPNCYECKWRGDLLGDCHSKCEHPVATGPQGLAACFVPELAKAILGVVGSSHGRRRGWFSWPLNFDPVWLESCNGFEKKEAPMRQNETGDFNVAVSPTNGESATNETNAAH